MRIVVLAGGTSTERDVSIVSGAGICNGLRAKGHNAVLIDVFCGINQVNWEDPFPEEYDVEAAVDYIRSFNKKEENSLVRTCWNCAKKQSLYFWGFMEPMEKTEECRQPLIFWESNTPAPDISAVPWQWIKA